MHQSIASFASISVQFRTAVSKSSTTISKPVSWLLRPFSFGVVFSEAADEQQGQCGPDKRTDQRLVNCVHDFSRFVSLSARRARSHPGIATAAPFSKPTSPPGYSTVIAGPSPHRGLQPSARRASEPRRPWAAADGADDPIASTPRGLGQCELKQLGQRLRGTRCAQYIEHDFLRDLPAQQSRPWTSFESRETSSSRTTPELEAVSRSALDLGTTVGGVALQRNERLTDLSAFQDVATIDGDLIIEESNRLTTLEAFVDVGKVTGLFELSRNRILDKIGGFSKLSQTGTMIIDDNDSLLTLEGFTEALNQVGGELILTGNDALTDAVRSVAQSRHGCGRDAHRGQHLALRVPRPTSSKTSRARRCSYGDNGKTWEPCYDN